MEVCSPGLVGGLILPISRAFRDALLILGERLSVQPVLGDLGLRFMTSNAGIGVDEFVVECLGQWGLIFRCDWRRICEGIC